MHASLDNHSLNWTSRELLRADAKLTDTALARQHGSSGNNVSARLGQLVSRLTDSFIIYRKKKKRNLQLAHGDDSSFALARSQATKQRPIAKKKDNSGTRCANATDLAEQLGRIGPHRRIRLAHAHRTYNVPSDGATMTTCCWVDMDCCSWPGCTATAMGGCCTAVCCAAATVSNFVSSSPL